MTDDKRAVQAVAWVIGAMVVAVVAGCKDDKPGTGGGGSGGGDAAAGVVRSDKQPLTDADREAVAFARKQIDEQFVKGADGWATQKAFQGMVNAYENSPEYSLIQHRDLTVTDVESFTVSEAEKLNGLEYNGRVNLKRTARRSYSPKKTMATPAGWSAWEDAQPAISVQKVKGQWKQPGAPLGGQRPSVAVPN